VPPQPAKTPKPPKAEPTKPPEPPRPGDAPEAPQPPPPARRLEGEPDLVNVRFEVMVSSQTGTGAPIKRTAIVTVSNGGSPGPTGTGMLRSGNNVPVASTTLTAKGEDGKETAAARPLTSYSYRSVGLNVDVNNCVVFPGNRVRSTLNIEFSGVEEKTGPGAGAPPSFPTFSQRLTLFFESGKPLLVAQSQDAATNIVQTVEVKATILR
jgi:hypothetical protein